MTKRILAIILSVTMIVTFLPVFAAAEDEDAPENFLAEVMSTTDSSVTIHAYAEDACGEIIYIVKESGATIALANGISGMHKEIIVNGLNPDTDYTLLVLASDSSDNFADGISLSVKTEASSTYAITDGTAQGANGSISFDKTSAAEGDTVTVTVDPAEGYQLKTLKYNDGEDHEITKDATTGDYQFTMPACAVTVTAVFEKKAFEISIVDNSPSFTNGTTAGYFMIYGQANDRLNSYSMYFMSKKLTGEFTTEDFDPYGTWVSDKSSGSNIFYDSSLEAAITGVADENGNIVYTGTLSLTDFNGNPAVISVNITVPAFESAITNGAPEESVDVNNGYLVIDKETSVANQTITVTPIAAEGCQLTSLTFKGVTDDVATEITKDATTGKYQFIMPTCAVTVTAEFEELPKIEVTNLGYAPQPGGSPLANINFNVKSNVGGKNIVFDVAAYTKDRDGYFTVGDISLDGGATFTEDVKKLYETANSTLNVSLVWYWKRNNPDLDWNDVVIEVTARFEGEAPKTAKVMLPAGMQGYSYAVSKEMVGENVEIPPVEAVPGGATYELPVGAKIGIYAVPETGYVVTGTNPYIIDKVTEDTTVDTDKLPKAELATYTVTFDPDNGESAFDSSVTHGDKANAPENPVYEGHTFNGWFAPEATEAFDFATPITANITLTAHWTKIHVHNLVKVDGQAATEEAAGFKDYYECKDIDDACGTLFEDEAGETPIENLDAWKAVGGNGYIAPIKPTATETEPTATGTEPTETEPTATGTEPTATGTEPTATGTEPTATGTEPTATGTDDGILGDANNDGNVNMKDVLAIRKALAGIEVTSYNAVNADCNVDGEVNMKDVLELRKYLAGLIETLGA